MKDKNNMILLDLCLLHLSLINNSSDEHKDLNAKTQDTQSQIAYMLHPLVGCILCTENKKIFLCG